MIALFNVAAVFCISSPLYYLIHGNFLAMFRMYDLL